MINNECKKCHTEISDELVGTQILRLLAGHKVGTYKEGELSKEIMKKGKCDWCHKTWKEIILGNLKEKNK